MNAPWQAFPSEENSYLVTREIEVDGEPYKVAADVRVIAPNEEQARTCAEVHFWWMVKCMAERL